MTLLQLNDVSVAGRLAPFSAQVDAGLQIHLIGPNGAGKSTLLACAAGVLPTTGDISLGATPLTQYSGAELARYRAYLSQQQTSVSLMPVFQYLSLHQPVGADSESVAITIGYLCEKLRLADKLPRSLTQLSGGEWQRVRLAAILLQVWPTVNHHSQLLLLDEPTNSLDVAQKVALDALLREFCASGRSVIVSAHDLNHSLQQADRIWLLAQGKLVAQGETLEVMRPEILSPIFEVNFQLHRFNQQNWIVCQN